MIVTQPTDFHVQNVGTLKFKYWWCMDVNALCGGTVYDNSQFAFSEKEKLAYHVCRYEQTQTHTDTFLSKHLYEK